MARNFKTLDDMGDIAGKRVLVREDLNVPMADGQVTDDTRLRATLATVTELADKSAIVLILAHFGRPRGQRNPEMSLALATLKAGDVAILENTRFHPGEEKNDPALAAAMAKLGDFYVNDACSAAHRAHASTEGLAHILPAY